MKYNSRNPEPSPPEVEIYECEVHLKFRMIEEKAVILDREKLLEVLMDAFACGIDDYMEPIQVQVKAEAVPEVMASSAMRRQLIRLRNTDDCISGLRFRPPEQSLR